MKCLGYREGHSAVACGGFTKKRKRKRKIKKRIKRKSKSKSKPRGQRSPGGWDLPLNPNLSLNPLLNLSLVLFPKVVFLLERVSKRGRDWLWRKPRGSGSWSRSDR
jgi:hypothetical protein